MKEQIVGVMSYPYIDKLVIRVDRQIDRFHLACPRTYSANYSNPEKVKRLMNRFLTLNALLQVVIVESRIRNWSNNAQN